MILNCILLFFIVCISKFLLYSLSIWVQLQDSETGALFVFFGWRRASGECLMTSCT